MLSCSGHVCLLLELDIEESLLSSHHVLVLDTHDTTAPDSAELFVVIVLRFECLGETIEISQVFFADIGDGDAGGSLQVAKLTEVGFSADEAEGDTLLSAESRKEDDHLDWVDVMGDNDEFGLVLFDEGGYVVKTKLEMVWLGGLAGTSFGFFLQTFLLVLLGLWAVLTEQFKELACYN